MRLSFLGAARMVTGSCYLLEAGGMRLLVDCGLFQGQEEELNQGEFPFRPGRLDAVLLTHAHIDHSGRLPLLVKQGYRGPIYTHAASADLARIMLLDSAHIHESEAERATRKGRRAGRPTPVEPLYTQADALAVVNLFKPISYGQMIHLNDQVRVRFQDAGHILGSALLEIWEGESKLLFSGDIGQPGRPILQEPTRVAEADYLVMESTYGNKHHQPLQSQRVRLAEIIRSTVAKRGNVIIPAFAVGRTQEMLFELNSLVESGQLPPNLQIVLDSPLAIAATEITRKHRAVFDEAAQARLAQGDDPFAFPGLRMTPTAEESKALNDEKGPKVIIAAAGMCDSGRILHHLRHNLWRSTSTVLFVGFQAEGSLGRRLVDGAPRVKIYGEDVAVKARIESLQGYSAHADQAQLLDWAGGLVPAPKRTFLVHGEEEGQAALSALLQARGHQVEIPAMGQQVFLSTAVPTPDDEEEELVHIAMDDGATLGTCPKLMAALLKELRTVRKSWFANGPHLNTDQAEEVSRRAEGALNTLEIIRRVLDAAER